jgi:hypothetical protein
MTAQYTFDLGPLYITKGGGKEALTHQIALALMMAQVRIQPGSYTITITKEKAMGSKGATSGN